MDPGDRLQNRRENDGLDVGDAEFAALRRLLRQLTGISLGDGKRYLFSSRLRRRCAELGLRSLADYYRHLVDRDPEGLEKARFVNAMTTNKTDFFREPQHFRYLSERWVPSLLERAALTGSRRVRVWSASCSSGEEPYSIAICILDALGRAALDFDVKILASDIDTDVLETAARGIYPLDRVSSVPKPLLARWFLRGTGGHAGSVRVREDLRRAVVFRRISLVEESWPIRSTFDAIFCRNVMIYFDGPTRARLLERLARQTSDGGILVLGQSESLAGPLASLEPVGHAIYRKGDGTSRTIGEPPAAGGAP